MSLREHLHRYMVKRRARHWTREAAEAADHIAKAQAYLEHAIRQRDAARCAVVWLDLPGHLHPQRASGNACRAPVIWNDDFDPMATRVAGPGHDEER